MPSLARARYDDRPAAVACDLGVVAILARAANDNDACTQSAGGAYGYDPTDAAGRPTSHGTWYTSYGWDNAENLQTLRGHNT